MADSKKHTPDALKTAQAAAVKAIEAVWEYSLVIESSVRRGDGPDQYAGVTEALRLVKEARSAVSAQDQDETGWQPIDTAPKDGTPILAWCDHEADPYHDEEADRLTDYGCWAEALGRVQDGLAVVQWGGEDTDYDEWSGKTLHWPNWWFRVGSDFQEVGNPTHWMPLPAAPENSGGRS